MEKNIEGDNLNSDLETDKVKKFGVNIISENEDNKIVWISFVVFVVALLIIGFFLFKYYERYQLVQGINGFNQEQNEEGSSDIQKQLAPEMKGKIYLTLARKSDEKDSTGIYTYDVKKESLEKLLINEGLQLLGGEISPRGDVILVNNGITLFMNDMTDISKWKEITDDEKNNFKNEPVWSKGGWSTIYSARDDASLDSNVPENWQIYSVDLEKNEKYLTNGIHPHVSKNNDIVFLKNDGLYAMGPNGENETKIWSIEGEAKINIQLDVSHIGNIGVLSNPNQRSLFIIRNKTENYIFEGEIVKELKTYAFQPTLSPDDKFLAVIELEKGTEDTFINPKLVVYNLETYEKEDMISLNNYKLDQIWLNDWR